MADPVSAQRRPDSGSERPRVRKPMVGYEGDRESVRCLGAHGETVGGIRLEAQLDVHPNGRVRHAMSGRARRSRQHLRPADVDVAHDPRHPPAPRPLPERPPAHGPRRANHRRRRARVVRLPERPEAIAASCSAVAPTLHCATAPGRSRRSPGSRGPPPRSRARRGLSAALGHPPGPGAQVEHRREVAGLAERAVDVEIVLRLRGRVDAIREEVVGGEEKPNIARAGDVGAETVVDELRALGRL